jgi:alkaline phosphatase
MVASTGIRVVAALAVVIVVVQSAAIDNYAQEKEPAYWYTLAENELKESLKPPTKGVAKNVILFLGDGMGPTSVTAGRIYEGQLLGKKGEEHKLSFDKFPYTGLSRTYNVDTQITDSAASGTAYLTGVKTNQGMLGLNAAAKRGDCQSASGAEVQSILHWSGAEGKSTGVVTTTRITHATPAASYSHSADRDWESDRLIPVSQRACNDIALQLVSHNSDINVILGGGRAYFYPQNFSDPDPDPTFDTRKVSRLDGRNLVEEWKSDKAQRNLTHRFVYDKQGLDAVDLVETDYLLGLFTQDHMTYDIDRDVTKEPSLAEMTIKAIGVLSKNENGFFLLVEGGKIDHGHHASKAHYALSDLVAMASAVEETLKITDTSETLIVVTADHSHVLGIAGYSSRGAPILGLSLTVESTLSHHTGSDKLPYTTLLYGNGPGYNSHRANVTDADTNDRHYTYQSAVPLSSETHGGEDVAIYAIGPQSFLYTGVHEQNYIPMVMAYASCVGPYAVEWKPCARDAANR